MKKPLYFIFIFFLFLLSGCSFYQSPGDVIVEHMNEKYDDTFTYVAPFGGGIGATTKQILVSSEKFPDAEIWVEMWEEDDGTVFADNYHAFLFEGQVRKVIGELLESSFGGEHLLIYEPGTRGALNDFTAATTYDEYVSSPNARIGFQAFVLLSDGYDFGELVEKYQKELVSTGIVVFGSVYVTEDRELFEENVELPSKTLAVIDCIQFDMVAPGEFARYEVFPQDANISQ